MVVAAGALAGVLILVKPSALTILAAVVRGGPGRVGAGGEGLSRARASRSAVCVLVIAPWTIRNYAEFDSFLPLSVQDAGIYGVFNDEAAHDDEHPLDMASVRRPATPTCSTPRIHCTTTSSATELRDNALEYVEDHPSSVPKAVFWNGLTRFWDVRDPDEALNEVKFQGRSRTLTWIGLVIWWILLPLGLIGLVAVDGAPAAPGIVGAARGDVRARLLRVHREQRDALPRAVRARLRGPRLLRGRGAGRSGTRREAVLGQAREARTRGSSSANELDYSDPDLDRFWASGEHDVDVLLGSARRRARPIGPRGRARLRRGPDDPRDRRPGRPGDRGRRLAADARDRARAEPGARERRVEARRREDARAGSPTRSAEVCLSHIVLQHMPDPQVTLGYVREMGRVLRPGGQALFQVSNTPVVHRAPHEGPRRRWSALRGRWPRGAAVRLPGSARRSTSTTCARRPPTAGMEIERIVGEGTQFCFVRARRRLRRRAPSTATCHWRICFTDGGRWKPSRSIPSKPAAVSHARRPARFGDPPVERRRERLELGHRPARRAERRARRERLDDHERAAGLRARRGCARALRRGRAGAAGSRR